MAGSPPPRRTATSWYPPCSRARQAAIRPAAVIVGRDPIEACGTRTDGARRRIKRKLGRTAPAIRWSRRAALIGSLACLSLLHLDLGSAEATSQPVEWGVAPVDPLSSGDFDLMARGRVGILRINMLWKDVEPRRGEFRFDYLDFVVGETAIRGIEVLAVPYGTPDWIDKDCSGLTESQCERVPPLATEAARTDWKQFIRALAARYGSGGTFWLENPGIPRQPVRLWEIWNEPSSTWTWQGEPSARAYAELLKISHSAINEVDREARVVFGGLFGTPEGDLSSERVMWRFLGRAYNVPGIKRSFDAIGLHPYSPDLAGIKFQLDAARRRIERNNDPRTEILITEIGWSSEPPAGESAEAQRRMLAQSFRMLRSQRKNWNLSAVVWYGWRDLGYTVDGCAFCGSTGLFEEDGAPKPAWRAFVEVTGGTP